MSVNVIIYNILPVLYELHCLPVFYCIYFKILINFNKNFIITFKAIHGMSPSIRSPSAYSFRLHCSIVLERPKGCMHATLGARSFSIAAPTVWNSFPMHICDIESLGPFERHVKTYLFRLTFALF